MPIFNYSSFSSETENITIFLDTLRNTKKEIILFPAGTISKGYFTALTYSEITISYFGDNSKDKVGTYSNGVEVLSFSEILLNHSDAYIIICSRTYLEEIRSQFCNAGFPNSKLLFNDFPYYKTIIDSDFYSEIQKKHKYVDQLYLSLADDLSKETLLQKLKYMYTFNPKELLKIRSDNCMYFDKDIISFSSNAIIIDGGAFVGDTFEEFYSIADDFSNYYAFEPDASNFSLLNQKLFNVKNVFCIKKGLWSKPSKLSFSSSDGASRIIENSLNSSISIDVTSIDIECEHIPITFIKLDVEGAEYEALLGAKNIILKNKPTLAVCVYHKPMDIIDLPLLLKQLCPYGQLYMRHYGIGGTDTVCYLIP